MSESNGVDVNRLVRVCVNCGATENTERRMSIGHGETAMMKPYRIDANGYCQYCKRYKPTFSPIIYPNVEVSHGVSRCDH